MKIRAFIFIHKQHQELIFERRECSRGWAWPKIQFLMLFVYTLVLCFIQTLSHLHGNEDLDPMVVRLATDSPLLPIYLVPIIDDQSQFTSRYSKQLEDVLNFDLNHNGSTYTVKQTEAANQLATSGSFAQVGSLADWREQSVQYVIKIAIHGDILSAFVLNVNGQSLKTIDSIPLAGDLSQDRRQIHKLTDTIHKALYGREGIASTHILYSVKTTSLDEKGISEIWEADYDGKNAHQITKGNHYCISPIYIPPKPGYVTGSFMYVSYQIGQPKIFVGSLKEGSNQRLTYLRGNQLMPTISPDRDKVAFISDVTGNPDLFVQAFSTETGTIGKPQQAFSAKQATQGSPTFSPDGNKLAFVSNKDGSPKIYVIEIPQPGASLKDIKATLISKQNRENSAPCWSPDGTKLAYCARSKGDRQIWIYDFTTKQEKQLTNGPGNKENPSWAPNSLHLVFNSSGHDASELYMINLNQAEATQITEGKGEKRFPSWEPRHI